jgi:hypothetical protein
MATAEDGEDQEGKSSQGQLPRHHALSLQLGGGDDGVVTSTHGPSNFLVSALRRPYRSNSQADSSSSNLVAASSRCLSCGNSIYRSPMTAKISEGASGAIRRFAGWVARGSVGYPMLEGINYWDALKDSPSQMEICFAIFVNVLELDESGEPVNEKYAENAPPRDSTSTAQASCHLTSQAWNRGKHSCTDLDLRAACPLRARSRGHPG